MDINLLTIMDHLRLALFSSLDFLVIAVWFSGESGLDILQIQYGYEYGYVWSRSFGRYICFVVKSSLFATKSSGIVEEPRAVFLHLFRVGHVLSFPAFSGWLVELFTVPFDECSDSMQEAITGATATIIYGLRIKPDSYSV